VAGLRESRIAGSDSGSDNDAPVLACGEQSRRFTMSHKYTLIVYTNPAEGREDEYNAWYDDVHLPEFSALPGVISGRRFKVVGDDKANYAAIYELSAHPDEVMAAMNAAMKDGTVRWSDAIDATSVTMTTLEPR
jgi:hypothetical protein